MATGAKKMTMMQLTVVVAVNMMGSGIIMLPTNMAKIGAISLLSWIVTALGSMAIAYGFAQAGIFNQRPGGMAAYAVTSYREFARTALRVKGIPFATALAPLGASFLGISDALRSKKLSEGPDAVEFAEPAGFDDRFDTFWRELQEQRPMVAASVLRQ